MSSRVSRARYLALALGTIALGLTLHLGGGALGPAVRDRLGDALWAAMIVWWLSVLAPRASPRLRYAAALVVCFAVEFSQLYHTVALDALRNTMLGQLVLGSGFDPGDLVAYTAGIVVAAAIDHALIRRPGQGGS